MQYKQFVIDTFETERGQWRARVSRGDGRTLLIEGQRLVRRLVTDPCANTQAEALLATMMLIDAGSVSVTEKVPIEKFWRRTYSAELR